MKCSCHFLIHFLNCDNLRIGRIREQGGPDRGRTRGELLDQLTLQEVQRQLHFRKCRRHPGRSDGRNGAPDAR